MFFLAKSIFISLIHIVNIPRDYVLPNLGRDVLERRNLDVDQLNHDRNAKTFIFKIHNVVKNMELDIGTSEAHTDSLVAHLVFKILDFDQWPFVIQ